VNGQVPLLRDTAEKEKGVVKSTQVREVIPRGIEATIAKTDVQKNRSEKITATEERIEIDKARSELVMPTQG